MNSPFDIFQMIPVDRVLWRGTAGTVEEAQARVRELGNDHPGKYLILSVQTGTGLVIDADGTSVNVTTDQGRIAPS